MSVYAEKRNKPRRGRPRDEEVHHAILKAATKMLRDVGYFEMSIEAIALKANVGKPTVYRWWPSKGYLTLEALIERGKDRPKLPDLGSLEKDLLQLFEHWSVGMEGKSSTAFNGLIAEAQVDEKLKNEIQEYIRNGKESFKMILQRASQRGEIADDVDLDVLSDLIYGSKWYRFLLNPEPVDIDFAKRVVEIIRHLRS